MHMTELEARLAAPDGPALRQELLQRLEALDWRLREQLRASVSREAFAGYEAAAAAAQAAQQVLRDWPVAEDGTPAPQFSPLLQRTTP